MPNAGIVSFPRDSEGKYPAAFEYVALGVLSKVASERGWLMSRPFEIADAQALLRHLEAALPPALKRQAERDVAKILSWHLREAASNPVARGFRIANSRKTFAGSWIAGPQLPTTLSNRST
jgi:hypothetical protein